MPRALRPCSSRAGPMSITISWQVAMSSPRRMSFSPAIGCMRRKQLFQRHPEAQQQGVVLSPQPDEDPKPAIPFSCDAIVTVIASRGGDIGLAVALSTD